MTVRRRLLWALAVTSLVASAVVATGSILLARRAVRQSYVERLRAEAALVAAWVEDSPAGRDLQELAERTSARLGVRVSLISADGHVLADSSKDRAEVGTMEGHLGRPEIESAARTGSGESFRRSATTNVEYLYAARLLEYPHAGGPVRFVRLALASAEVHRAQTRLAWLVAAVVPAAMLLLAGMGYAAVRRLSRPVERMADAVERSVAGESRLEPPHDGGEEIERLGEAVRRMQLALLGKVAELDAERTLMASVIAGMHEGLLLVGPDRRIRLANAAIRGILQLPFDPQGRQLAETARHPVVIRDIEAALSTGVESGESIVRVPELDRCFELRVAPLAGRSPGAAGEALALFFDVTRLERLENVRREFVADVSHELRTPLTSIKAFVETLLDGGSEDPVHARRFLEIVRKHADRMSELIADLTDLSLIETGAIRLELEEIDAGRVVRDVTERLQPLAQKRGVELILDIEGALPIHADRRRLEQMVSNLLDNAIKFSSAGGRVWIRGAAHAAGATLAVKDEGIGIPAGSQEKVFHRFYQEDRARSREAGGTGLGLAIVKHLMRLHGGSVRLESELGRGSEFSLEFPAPPRA